MSRGKRAMEAYAESTTIRPLPFLEDAMLVGTCCDKCGQRVQLYRRNLTKNMVRLLGWLISEYEARREPVKIDHRAPRWVATCPQISTPKYWGLCRRLPSKNPKFRTSATYLPTVLGIGFIRGGERIPRDVFVYNDTVYAVSKDLIGVRDVDADFDYDKLMRAGWELMSEYDKGKKS